MSPRLARFILTASIACLGTVRAEEAAATNKPPAYALKNKSSFTATGDEQRAPFWPIGWVKRRPLQATAAAPVQHVEAPKVVLDQRSFKVTSILLGNPSLAIINGRTYSEGEYLRTPKGAAPAVAATVNPAGRIRVFRINDGHVVLQNADQLITVLLQRPELVQRSSVEETLSEER